MSARDTVFAPNLQSWIRNGDLDPDWLRVGTDIVGGAPPPGFNAAFPFAGVTSEAVPEPPTLLLFAGALLGFALLRRPSPA